MSRAHPSYPASQNLPRSARLSSHGAASRMRTPIMTNGDSADHASTVNGAVASEAAAEEDRRTVEFRERFKVAESRLMSLFGAKEEASDLSGVTQEDAVADGRVDADATKSRPAPKKPARNIDEDDYGDDEDEEEQEDDAGAQAVKSPQMQSSSRPALDRSGSGSQSKDASDPNKQNEDEQEAEEAAKRDFHLYFYTLENDRAAMEEQRQLDKLDQDLEAEVSGQQNDRSAVPLSATQAGSLSTSNLGASSLMLGNLLKRIDSKRGMVAANDAQLRRLISEVRKNRSKWASEDKVNQEELYEPAEKVLQNLKAMTEYSTPFLQRVSKREASDYYSVIKNPMDIGTMMKKLKTLQYKNRTEIVGDLNLIWNNCLAYNSDPNHPLRKKALYLQKKTDELIRHIPDVEVRSRAEVEAEERKNARMDAEAAGVEDSEDEEPIMASRGRKAPSKSNKGSSNARKAPTATEGTPGAETKQQLHASGSSTNLKNQFLRADSDHHMENGFGTPPPAGRLTPLPNGLAGETVSQADPSEVEGTGQLADMPLEASEDPEADDIEYRMWKQVTKKARATMAVQRHNLFQKGQIAPEQPALLRTKAGMRQWMRQQKKILGEDEGPDSSSSDAAPGGAQPVSNETLAEAMEEENDTQLPDYYDPLSAIPEIPPQLRWEDDTEGNVVMHSEETLRMLPAGQFTSPDSILTRKMEANMRQMQETRKVCAKIGVVKQMQLQSQMYSNQFQKYEPQPFLEQDVEPTVVSDEGPFIAPWLCRATFQRSIARIFFHAGFEEFQPSALDAVTDVATSYYQKLVKTMLAYAETTNLRDSESRDASDTAPVQRQPSFEENVLHALDEQGTDIEALESYVKDDVERLGTKLGVMHERMKAHLADLLRPALDPSQVGADGVGAFNDNSEQFAHGDFADDIGEDFFGFKELGLDSEFGMTTLSVPFHLLHSRLSNAYQSTNTTATSTTGNVMEPPAPFEAVTLDSVQNEVGLVQDFFLAKLTTSNEPALVEDDDLPIKQRFPKPRLPPTGKISSPRKRPLREQQQMAKKKRKLEEGREDLTAVVRPFAKPAGKLRLEPPQPDPVVEPEKDDDAAPGMMSPESM